MLEDRLKAPSRFAFIAGRELGWRDKWMIVARDATDPAMRRTFVRFARECHRGYLRNMRDAIAAQPKFYS